MRVCDGCGAPADEAHIRARIERLELATRFRPIHIVVLLVEDSPAARAEDYFYRPSLDGAERSLAAKSFFREMLAAAGIPLDMAANEETALAEFQRRGFYLADAVECPIATPDERRSRVAEAIPTIVKRVEFSYRPKHVMLIGEEVTRFAPALLTSSIADRIFSPSAGTGDSANEPITGERIAAALAHLS